MDKLEDSPFIVTTRKESSISEDKANARLIAEAPAMAEALKDALFCIESGEKLRNPEWDGSATPTSTIGKIRAVLARIKGEPQ